MWELWALAPEDGTRSKLLAEYTLDQEVLATRDLITLHNTDRDTGTHRALTLVKTDPSMLARTQTQLVKH